MKRIVNYFLNGLLLVAPLFIIIYILYHLFVTVDGFLAKYIKDWLGFFQPGIGIAIIIVFLTILGFIGQTALVKPVSSLFKRLVGRIPIVNFIFTSLDDLFKAFIGKDKKFNVPVAVHFNVENNLWKLGFLTTESLESFNLKEMAAVYFPHSYNFSGELYVVPSDRIKKLDISPAEAMKFIVSGGVTKIGE